MDWSLERRAISEDFKQNKTRFRTTRMENWFHQRFFLPNDANVTQIHEFGVVESLEHDKVFTISLGKKFRKRERLSWALDRIDQRNIS